MLGDRFQTLPELPQHLDTASGQSSPRIHRPGVQKSQALQIGLQGRHFRADAVGELQRRLARLPAQLALAWCANNSNVSTVILGASKAQQLQENLQALELLPKLTPEVLAKIETVMQNRPEPPEDFTY